jgi:hypothetical protein
MKTLLDEFHTTFLHAVIFNEGHLRIIVAEGFRASQPVDLVIGGHVIKGTYDLHTSAQSRLVEVGFNRPVAWQLVDESFTTWDDYEERDDKSVVQVLTRSRYLEYVRANHGWFEDMRGPGKHYRVWTENEVIDVVASDPPTINLTRKGIWPGRHGELD